MLPFNPEVLVGIAVGRILVESEHVVTQVSRKINLVFVGKFMRHVHHQIAEIYTASVEGCIRQVFEKPVGICSSSTYQECCFFGSNWTLYGKFACKRTNTGSCSNFF